MNPFKALAFSFAAAIMVLAVPMLGGCASTPLSLLPTTPAAAADKTVLDEKLMIAVEEAYKVAGAALETLSDMGLIKGDLAARVDKLDGDALIAVTAMHTAYNAANADSYRQAIIDAGHAVAEFATLANSARPATTGSIKP